MHQSKFSLLTLILFFAWGSVSAKLFVPDSEPIGDWDRSDESSTVIVDHSPWQGILDRYLQVDTEDGVNRFNYAAVTESDREILQSYLQSLGQIDPRALNRNEQFPYWVNMYNALTVHVVLDHYPVKSIRKIYGGIFDTGPWNKPLLEVSGEELSLNNIEHNILRPIWRDPRIHYAVNCASIGCPNLAPQAFTSSNSESLLNQAARDFVNHSRGANFANGKLQLSSIYNWYDVDFGSNQTERLQHLQQYAEPELADQLAAYSGKIRYDYDWQLNQP